MKVATSFDKKLTIRTIISNLLTRANYGAGLHGRNKVRVCVVRGEKTPPITINTVHSPLPNLSTKSHNWRNQRMDKLLHHFVKRIVLNLENIKKVPTKDK